MMFFAETVYDAPASFEHDAAARIEAALSEPEGTAAPRLLDHVGVEARIADATNLGYAEGSFDLLISNNTLEHIPADTLTGIMTEFRRVGGADAVASHLIDLMDHYSFFDPSISMFNFLQYSESRWRWFNNDIHYQNRLRFSDYETIFQQAGWRIADTELTRDLASLEMVDPDVQWAAYDQQDLAVGTAWASLVANGPAV